MLALVYFIFITVTFGVLYWNRFPSSLNYCDHHALGPIFSPEPAGADVHGCRVVTEQEEPHLYEVMSRCVIAGILQTTNCGCRYGRSECICNGQEFQKLGYCSYNRAIIDADPGRTRGSRCPRTRSVKNRDVMIITLASLISTAAFFIFRNSFMLPPEREKREG